MKYRVISAFLLLTFIAAFVGLGALLVLHHGDRAPEISFETVPPGEIMAVVTEAERHFTANLTGAIAGDAALVRSLDRNAPDFYLIPFSREDITAVAQITVLENGTPRFSRWRHDLSGTVAWMRPPFTTAIVMLGDAGYPDQKWTARMVSIPREEPVMPFCWEFENEGGEKVYIGYDLKNDEIRVISRLTPGQGA
ncbi:hypothetical protein J2129_000817 [Methanofollis sp. W23]|uniref:hypothetical protein n=1 Tax=Methanofollis sp. W23 TaxID=2817849 RepID=UPI001AEA2F60|nr:hypothetical protein [Methanofollis sp. W23]MBP2145363.1 hypothetical protein [Methanofollis sp. W23]